MKQIFVISILISFFITNCASFPKTEKTQLQIRAFQTRTYDITESKLILKAVLNVLQDDGFIVKNAVPEIGLLTATKEIDIEREIESIPAFLFGGTAASWIKSSIIDATCNISDFGDKYKVRVNFTQKILDNRGNIVQIRQIDDQKFYQTFFTKLDKSIYLQKTGL